MKVRNATVGYTEMGTDKSTLVVLYPTAKAPFKNGYSGIYHLAIHLSNEGEFARVLARLLAKRHPISPTDHTMSKAIYMKDPDGITVEITLETPERLERPEIGNSGARAIDKDGTVRSPSAPLDVESVMKALPDNDIDIPYKNLPEADYATTLKGFGLPEGMAQAIAGWDVAISNGDLFEDSRQLSKLIGRPTTPLAAALKEMLATSSK
jgi:hypothetical protein